MAKYVFPAIFTPEDGGKYTIDFPDISGCYTYGENLFDGLEMAADALRLMLEHYEEEGRPIPNAAEINSIPISGDSFSTYIMCETAPAQFPNMTAQAG